jgi:pimeloyl-ACP methyl ester carboxylesterase
VVGGVSMGGYVAMAFHRLFPARLRALVFVDTRAGADSDSARTARDDAAALVRAEGSSAIAAKMLPQLLTPASVQASEALRRALGDLMSAQSVDGIVGALAAIRDRPDSRRSLAAVTVPTLVVCGAEDTLIPKAESEALRDAVPGARLALIAEAGHLPNYERPDAFNDVVRAFLAAL